MGLHSKRVIAHPAILAAMVMALTAPSRALAQPSSDNPSAASCKAFAGIYAARHIEMGGGIMLRPDGTFLYQLAYGALDEEAGGTWTCDGPNVVLTSDHLEAPRFDTLSVNFAQRGRLQVVLELPDGMSRQYFSVLIHRSDGSAERQDFGEDGLTLDFSPQDKPVSIQPLLPIYDIAGDPIPLPAGDGFEVRLRFLPNDLGKVAFSQTSLEADGESLSLQRFGVAIRFQRTSTSPAE